MGYVLESAAWYGDDSSWNEGPCKDRYEEMAEDYIDETKDFPNPFPLWLLPFPLEEAFPFPLNAGVMSPLSSPAR